MPGRCPIHAITTGWAQEMTSKNGFTPNLKYNPIPFLLPALLTIDCHVAVTSFSVMFSYLLTQLMLLSF